MQQRTRGSGVQLILRGAGQGDLAGDLPDAAAAFPVRRRRTQSGIFADALALDLLQALHEAMSMPSGSCMYPAESDMATTFAPSCWAFSQA